MENTAVYVDEVRVYAVGAVSAGARRHGVRWCHMWTEPGNEDALHVMAERIGLKREWFQDREGFPHYDLVMSARDRALKSGAKEKDLRQWVTDRRMEGLK